MTPAFKERVEKFGPRFKADLGLTNLQVAGMFGNFAVETGQFKYMQEIAPVVKGSKGGRGWAQWTGYTKNNPRRKNFEEWCAAKGLNPDHDEANYGFVVHELRGTEKAALAALKRTKTLDTAAETFMKKYERPGVPHLQKRKDYALEALHVLEPPARPADAPMMTAYVIKALQQQLNDLGYKMVGKIDGKSGPRTKAAITAFQDVNGLPLTGEFDKATLAKLNGNPKAMPLRPPAPASDVAKEAPIVADANAAIKGGIGAAIGIPALTGLSEWIDGLRSVRDSLIGLGPFGWSLLASVAIGFLVWRLWVIRERRLMMYRVGETA